VGKKWGRLTTRRALPQPFSGGHSGFVARPELSFLLDVPLVRTEAELKPEADRAWCLLFLAERAVLDLLTVKPLSFKAGKNGDMIRGTCAKRRENGGAGSAHDTSR
jgi:hypothetical protein